VLLGLAKACFLKEDYDDSLKYYQGYSRRIQDIKIIEGNLLRIDETFRL